MLRSITFVLGLTVLGAAGGCYTDDYYHGYDLQYEYAGPGVSVVANYDYPVFYADNYYWRYDNGLWYRAPHFGGHYYYAVPPGGVIGAYRNYHFPYYGHYGHYGHYHPTYHAGGYGRPHHH